MSSCQHVGLRILKLKVEHVGAVLSERSTFSYPFKKFLEKFWILFFQLTNEMKINMIGTKMPIKPQILFIHLEVPGRAQWANLKVCPALTHNGYCRVDVFCIHFF